MEPSNYKIAVIALIIGVLSLSISTNPPQGNTGAPFEGSCNRFGCHFGGNPSIMGTVDLVGIPEKVERGLDYNLQLRIEATCGSPVRAGFQMIAVGSDAQNSGTFSEPGMQSTFSSFEGRTYFEHQPAKHFESGSVITYDAVWTAPEDFINHEITTFYISSILANGSNDPTGDTYLHREVSVQLKIDSTFIEDCTEVITIAQDILPGEYLLAKTNETVFSHTTVQQKGQLILQAVQGAELEHGFTVDAEAVLEISNQGCN